MNRAWWQTPKDNSPAWARNHIDECTQSNCFTCWRGFEALGYTWDEAVNASRWRKKGQR